MREHWGLTLHFLDEIAPFLIPFRCVCDKRTLPIFQVDFLLAATLRRHLLQNIGFVGTIPKSAREKYFSSSDLLSRWLQHCEPSALLQTAPVLAQQPGRCYLLHVAAAESWVSPAQLSASPCFLSVSLLRVFLAYSAAGVVDKGICFFKQNSTEQMKLQLAMGDLS